MNDTKVEIEAVNTGGWNPVQLHIIVRQIDVSYPQDSYILQIGTEVDISPVLMPLACANEFFIAPSLPNGLVWDQESGMFVCSIDDLCRKGVEEHSY